MTTHAQFLRDLRSLLRAPYAFIHLDTHEEDRALELLREIGASDSREILQWSAVTGFEGNASSGDVLDALRIIEGSQRNAIFVLKDAAGLINGNPLALRRLREIEGPCAAFGKTVVLLGPVAIDSAELQKDVTHIALPLPDRAAILRECDQVFDAAKYPSVDREALVSGAMGLTAREAHRAFHRVRLLFDEAQRRNQPFDLARAILAEKQRLVGTSDVLEFHPLDQGMDDVGGLGELKRWLEERKRAFGDEARRFGLPAPKGVLLVGVQGCGKSLTAKVVGRHWGLPLLRLDLGAVFEGRRSPEEALRSALRTCDAIAPCVLWLDEIEKGFEDSDGRSSRVLGSLLTWQQEKTSAAFLVATANDVTRLPPELLRKGRFDEIFFVDLPEIHERREIFRIHLVRHGRMFDDTEIERLAEKTEYFSGAEIEQVVIAAMYTAFADEREVEVADLDYAIQETIPLYRTYEEQIKGLREWADGRARRASHRRKVLDFFG